MSKKLFIVLFLLLLVIILGSLFARDKDERNGSVAGISSNGKAHIIELSEEGFSPSEITIQKGDTIKFITTGDKFFWPASNLHPTHTIYPEFDPREPFASDESWSFRFEKAGTWKYHDHLAPYFTGEIEVLK